MKVKDIDRKILDKFIDLNSQIDIKVVRQKGKWMDRLAGDTK